MDEAVAKAMKPFARDGTGAVERDVWDSYRICGGHAGLPVLAGHARDPRLITGRPSWDGTREPEVVGWYAGAPRELIDFGDRQRVAAAEHAGRVWDRWQEVAAGHPVAHDESVFYHRHLAAGGTRASYPASSEAVDYRLQPAVRDWAEIAPTLSRPDIADHFTFGHDPVGIGQRSRQDYVSTYAASLLPRRNVLTLDGWWHDLDEEPLHGGCHGRATCVHEPDMAGGHLGAQAYLDDLPGDTLLVNVRCHV
ncbi:hypothetical protein [Kitasatospora sp. NPDC050463]|uniref:hypothetical protein n=1 Tax=Kitasatospora sp. NPDC050463 TaxID=3155786 RepID=UPI0033E963B2